MICPNNSSRPSKVSHTNVGTRGSPWYTSDVGTDVDEGAKASTDGGGDTTTRGTSVGTGGGGDTTLDGLMSEGATFLFFECIPS